MTTAAALYAKARAERYDLDALPGEAWWDAEVERQRAVAEQPEPLAAGRKRLRDLDRAVRRTTQASSGVAA